MLEKCVKKNLTGVDERFVATFQHHTDLRVQPFGQDRVHVEKRRIEFRQIFHRSDFGYGTADT